MPTSDRDHSLVIFACVGTVIFSVIMGAYVALDIAGRDTDAFVRFLTLLMATLVPSVVGALRANSAAHTSLQAVAKVEAVQEKLNGTLDARMREANRETRREEEENGRPAV